MHLGKKIEKEMMRKNIGHQYSKEAKMNNSVLKSPVLWVFLILILMFVSLSNTKLVWAGPDLSNPRQTVPTFHYIFLPLIEKNYP